MSLTILNEKVVNYKVTDLFEYYNFILGHLSIRYHLIFLKK